MPRFKGDLTRIYFATDVHGSEIIFRKFTNAPKVYGTSVLILGGDVTGKSVVPIVKQSDGTYDCSFMNERKVIKEDELKGLVTKVDNSGAYSCIVTRQEHDEIKSDPQKLDELFRKLMRERLSRWVQLAEERLKASNSICYITGGNDDPQEAVDAIKETEHVKNPDAKVVHLSQLHEMASLGWGNFTPWKTARECSEEELAQRIEKMTAGIEDMENAIFNFHVPPLDSVLDSAPMLDASVYPPKPIMAGADIVYAPAGSQSVRRAIEKHQPLLGLHGHIHESRASAVIGKTLCLNPGSDYTDAILRGVVVELSDKKVVKHQFMMG